MLSSTALIWGVALILLPLSGALLTFLFRAVATPIGICVALAINLCTVRLAWLISTQEVPRYPLGGWGAPLGIDLYVDGLSMTLLIMSAVVGLAISCYAPSYFRSARHKLIYFWPLWLFLWTALNALFLSADIFNLYVTLELLSLAAVALAALAGSADALTGAMRYLLVSLLGSLCYLLGVALLYHAYATVDIALLAERVVASPITSAAFGLMMAGLLLKTALFPLHFWLPPAHASAAAPVSALLSALVVKASYYLLLRLWLEVFGNVNVGIDVILGVFGAAAVLWGSLQALRQSRLKLLIAYSTVAQLGYLFVVFPLAAVNANAWQGALYLALSHAFAKAAMFLAAGNMLLFCGHDRIIDLDRVVQRLPLSLSAFALAGVSIIGLPPSGGFIGKWLLLEVAVAHALWGWAVVIVVGGILAAAYVFRVVGHAFTPAKNTHEVHAVPAVMEWVALVLATSSILLGLSAAQTLMLFEVGDPFRILSGEAPS
ncbi:multisubunit sodium/proton antiporter MrpD subunit [Nitrosomonas nitrosa]|uniref:Multisubunit sodium/proton antiporter, MrpD subunit n=1 Tax=Nitrosomonas nitrosa TaxID=52442 RepID=A0A1I4P964_9PROT|nr:proton-conducting transporter membrane subunit [Nitrosomonas nitrosa]MCO6434545.1 hypothetical protein [Nitrosomonas nitrosa]PTQ97095.1 multisubunit sodium/proton antiporter MrpD subunit [Nitrosomonas nitrosa]CAE6509839.1 NADH/Ubiquinone/plastoquinone (Complex I) [Nitrosomonas nitrosa]SFM24087.1 multisubunit sodium/proton antiporter, MrpD subunit [Nitrosomonas nitrosa]